MFHFATRPRIGRPVPVAPPGGDVQFPGTTVFVRSRVIPQTGGQFAPTVLQHLAEIQAFPVGQAFLRALSALGKRQVISYAGPNVNQAAGGGVVTYKLLRRYHDAGEQAGFAAELRRTLGLSGRNKRWLADQCYRTPLPRWSGANSPSPFGNLPRAPAVPVAPGQVRPLPATPVDLTERLLDDWLDGTALPDRDQMDILCLVLERWLRNGSGANTLVSYDPHKVVVAGVHRPPQVALFHELVHAYYNAAGGQLGREDSVSEANGGRLFELMAVGLPPFDTRPFSENQFRRAVGVAPRPHYP
jgi:hypothetical protein